MNVKNHSKMYRLIQLSLDGRLAPSQQQVLDAHLADCVECGFYAAELKDIETQLASVSATRLVPSIPRQAYSTAAIHKRYRRYQVNKQILSLAGTLAVIVLVAVLFRLFGYLVPGQSSPAAAPSATILNGASTATSTIPTPTPQYQPLRYFTRADSDQLTLQPWQLTPQAETPTPDPGFISNLTLAEAQGRAGYEVFEPVGLARLASFLGASLDPRHNIVRLFYTNGFVLREEPDKTDDDCELCGVVGASAAVETVQIGDVIGEYVVGVWKLTDSGPVWESDPFMKVLRWQANGMAFELMHNPTQDPESVTKEDIIAIAESLISEAAATVTPQSQVLRFFTRADSDQLPLKPWQLTPQVDTPTPNPGWNFNLSIVEAEQMAGFKVLAPGWLPEAVIFGGASYLPNQRILRIFYPRKSEPTVEYGFVLQIESGQFSNACDDLCGQVGLSAQVDTVQINGFPGEYIVGAWIFTGNGPLWEQTSLHKVLRWQVNGMSYQLTYSGGPDDVTQADMIAIAESVR